MKLEARGQVDLMILSILATAPAHGYRVIEELRARSGGALDLPEGTIYPALYRLERAGLLSSRWDDGEGRRRRVYRLTRRGRGALAQERQEWESLVRAVEAVVR